MTATNRSHAVVIGGSMAGLTAARVLADLFDRVSLVERDRLADSREPRKGAPQAHHLHGLLLRGQQLMEQLFPGLVAGLLAEGAEQLELGRDLAFFHYGGWKARSPVGIPGVAASRLLLEAEVRKRTLANPKIHLLDGSDAVQLTTDAGRSRVTGVVLRRSGAGAEESLEADLVVDASGRGSRLPAWLEEMGRKRVEESTVAIDVGYATRCFRRPPDGRFPWKGLFAIGEPPEHTRLGAIWPIEGGQWMVSLVGMLGDHPPADEPGWMEFARTLPVPDLHDALAGATPVTGVSVYRFPSQQRRHYERMEDFPDGLAVLGDAHCSFSPSYGQGMTIAAIGALLLGDRLARGRARGGPPGFSRAFQKALARSSDGPWTSATSEDYRFPEVEGQRPPGSGLVYWYLTKLHRAATVDPEVTLRFYRVMQMLASPATLLSPGAIWRVLRGQPQPARAAALNPPGA